MRPGLRVEEGEHERGLATETDIAPGEALVRMPFTSLMVVTNGIEDPCPFHPEWGNETWWKVCAPAPHSRLASWLLQERDYGERSPWHAYVSTLPWDVDSVMFWNEEELAQLQNQEVLRRIRDQKEAVDLEYSGFARAHSADGLAASKITLEDWKRAIHMVTSRSFGAGGAAFPKDGLTRRWMWPFLDMANHDGAMAYDAASQQVDESGVAMMASKPFKAGETVCISYGPIPNDACLTSFGFLPETENENDLLGLDVVLKVLARSMADPEVPTGLRRIGDEDLARAWELSRDICFQNPQAKTVLVERLGLSAAVCAIGTTGFTEGVAEVVRLACATSAELRGVDDELFAPLDPSTPLPLPLDVDGIGNAMAAVDSLRDPTVPDGPRRTLAMLLGICLSAGNQLAAVPHAGASVREDRLAVAAQYRKGKQALLRKLMGLLLQAWASTAP